MRINHSGGGLGWFGRVWEGLGRFGRFGMVWEGLGRFEMIWDGRVWEGIWRRKRRWEEEEVTEGLHIPISDLMFYGVFLTIPISNLMFYYVFLTKSSLKHCKLR